MKQRCFLVSVWIVVYGLFLLCSGCKTTPEDLYKKGMSLYQAEKYQKAIQAFESLLVNFPESTLTRKTLYQLGNIYFYKLNQPENALKHLQALSEYPQNGKYRIEALKLIGYIYDKSLNRCLEGVNAYRTLLENYAKEIDAGEYQMAIGDCFFKLHDYEQALVEYETLLEKYPHSQYIPRAKFQTANCYALKEEYDKAIELYTELLQPETISTQLTVDVNLELAYCYGQKELLEEALAIYQDVLKVDSANIIIDREFVARKVEWVQKRIEENNRKPSEVDWSRRTN